MTQFKTSTRKKEINHIVIYLNTKIVNLSIYTAVYFDTNTWNIWDEKNHEIWIFLWSLPQNLRKQTVEKGFIDIIKLLICLYNIFLSLPAGLCCKYCLCIYYSLTNKTKFLEHRTENWFFFFFLTGM